MRLIAQSDDPLWTTGFGSQLHNLLFRLKKARPDWEIGALHWNHRGKPFLSAYGYQLLTDFGQGHFYNAKWNVDHYQPDLYLTLYDIFVSGPFMAGGFADADKAFNGLGVKGGYSKTQWVSWFVYDMLRWSSPRAWARYLQLCDVPVAMSQYGQDSVLENYACKAFMIYHGVDPKQFPEIPAEQVEGARMQLGNPDFILGGLFRNIHRKQTARLLEAWSRVCREYPDVKLFLNNRADDKDGFDLALYEHHFNLRAPTLKESRVVTGGQLSPLLGVSPEQLNLIYQLCDAQILPTQGEGFGIPIIEGYQACFTQGHEILAENIERGFVREYAGPLLDIETERGYRCTVTPNHRFLTPQGWKYAQSLNERDLVYVNSDSNDGDSWGEAVDSGRIEVLTRQLPNGANSTFKDSRASTFKHLGDDISSWITSDLQRHGDYEEDRTQRTRDRLHRRIDRWRRHSHFSGSPMRTWWKTQVSSSSVDNEHKSRTDDMASSKATRERYSLRNRNKCAERPPSLLQISHNGNGILPILPSVTTLPYHQVPSNDFAITIHRKPIRNVQLSRLLRLRNDSTQSHTLVEPETITKIRRRNTFGIAVYNLKTSAGIYFSNNIVVHNCGLPVLMTDCSTYPELVGEHGLPIATDGYDWTSQAGAMALPSTESMEDAMRIIIDDRKLRVKFQQANREFVKQFSFDDFIIPQWLALIERICPDSKPVEKTEIAEAPQIKT